MPTVAILPEGGSAPLVVPGYLNYIPLVQVAGTPGGQGEGETEGKQGRNNCFPCVSLKVRENQNGVGWRRIRKDEKGSNFLTQRVEKEMERKIGNTEGKERANFITLPLNL